MVGSGSSPPNPIVAMTLCQKKKKNILTNASAILVIRPDCAVDMLGFLRAGRQMHHSCCIQEASLFELVFSHFGTKSCCSDRRAQGKATVSPPFSLLSISGARTSNANPRVPSRRDNESLQQALALPIINAGSLCSVGTYVRHALSTSELTISLSSLGISHDFTIMRYIANIWLSNQDGF